MRWTITLEYAADNGRSSTVTVVAVDRPAGATVTETVGLSLQESKEISRRLQETIVVQQLDEHAQARRPCPTCGSLRPLKDYRGRRLHTVLGTVRVAAPRFRRCRLCSGSRISNPISELLPDRVLPEVRHLQVSLGARMPYREAAGLLREFLPLTGGVNHASVRNRVLAVGHRIEAEIQEQAAADRVPAEPARQMVVGIDGAFVKERRPTRPGVPASLEILTGCIETDAPGLRVFGIVRDQCGQAKRHLQALLRVGGRGPNTEVRILCDGEEGIRSMVSKLFQEREKHVLDWFHIARQLDGIGKSLLYFPGGEEFQRRLHWARLKSARWNLWNGNLCRAGMALTSLWGGIDVQSMTTGLGRSTAELIRQRLDRLWSYLCANQDRIIDYAEERRAGHRVSTAHVESTVNQLVNHRMCKRQQMRWSRRGAQMLLNARCALLNRELSKYTGWSEPTRSGHLAAAA